MYNVFFLQNTLDHRSTHPYLLRRLYNGYEPWSNHFKYITCSICNCNCVHNFFPACVVLDNEDDDDDEANLSQDPDE